MSRLATREGRASPQADLDIAYFGKIPSRGDFVKASTGHPQLLATLDRWAAQAIELMSIDTRWKLSYDAALPLHFAFLGSRSRLGIAGYLAPSRDASERRFPFIAATAFEVDTPIGFIARSPLALSNAWARLDALAQAAITAADSSAALGALTQTRITLEASSPHHNERFDDFVEIQTLGALEALLDSPQRPVQLKRLLIALGVLLQPLLTHIGEPFDKNLVLPLPRDAHHRATCAAYWLELLAPFVARIDVELAIFIAQLHAQPVLVIGFEGASPAMLESVLHPTPANETRHVVIDDAEWVDAHVAGDPSLSKLAAYLDRPQLSLATARMSFFEAFIGA
ncbi:MAG TPA: type VI secretion system-associated protein TagF [Burkholderiaceae bacterium]|nr:type VI secretion system-associated protein TagF [Burkholderiaceae bacterium]